MYYVAVNLAIPPSETPLLLHTMPFNRADSQETSYCSLRNTTPLTPCSPVDSDRPLSWNGDPFDELVFPDGAPCTPMVQSNGGRAQEPVSPVICEPFPTPYYRPEVQSNGGCAEGPVPSRVSNWTLTTPPSSPREKREPVVICEPFPTPYVGNYPDGDSCDESVSPDDAPGTPMGQSNGGPVVICEPNPTPYVGDIPAWPFCERLRGMSADVVASAEEPSVDRVDALRTYVCEVNDLTGDDPVVDLTREGIDLTGDDGETIPATPTVSGPPGSLRAQKRPLCPHASRQEWGWTPEPSPGDCDPSVGASSKKAKRD